MKTPDYPVDGIWRKGERVEWTHIRGKVEGVVLETTGDLYVSVQADAFDTPSRIPSPSLRRVQVSR